MKLKITLQPKLHIVPVCLTVALTICGYVEDVDLKLFNFDFQLPRQILVNSLNGSIFFSL